MYQHNYFIQLKSAIKEFIQNHLPSVTVYLEDLAAIPAFPTQGVVCLQSAYDTTTLGEEGEGRLEVALNIWVYLPQIDGAEGDSAITDLGLRLGDALLWGVVNDSALATMIKRINHLRSTYGRNEDAGSSHREYLHYCLLELEVEMNRNRLSRALNAP